MNCTGSIIDIDIENNTLKPKISLVLDLDNIDIVEELKKENRLQITINKWYKKRSNDANSYCWVLCDMIAKKLITDGLIITKEQIYKDTIKQVGVFEPMIVSEKAYENFKRIWEKQGLGFITEKVNKKDKCVKLHCYYGSSSYNTKEMSILLNLLVDLAKNLGLETKTKNEIDSLVKSW